MSSAALVAWTKALGPERVVVDAGALDHANRTTFASTAGVRAILSPANVDEVRACVRIAHEHRAALYPVSRGLNWGYGSRVPPRDCAALVDLSRMNALVAYDDELGTVTVEPGVTFGMLSAHLAEAGGKHFSPVHGGPPESSVLGHVLERGLGKGPYAERWLHACGYEVVLANGDVVHTGFGRFDGAACRTVSRTAPGPVLDGLFTQSSFGIVTKMTIWLAPATPHAASFVFAAKSDAALAPLVDAVRLLKLEGTLRSSCLLANDIRRMAFSRQYPWDEAGGVTPMPRDVRERLSRGIAWSGDGALYPASVGQLAADKARIREVLGPVADVIAWSDEPVTGPIPAEVVQTVHSLNVGRPLARTAATAYWRKRGPLPEVLDPDRDRCGFVSFSPAIPFRGRDARKAIDILDAIMSEHGFEPNLGLNCVGERVIDLTPMLLYDRDVSGADEAAERCHDAMLAAFAREGWHPYRLTSGSMQKLPPSSDGFDRVVDALKTALDPNDVIAPGRYDFRPRLR